MSEVGPVPRGPRGRADLGRCSRPARRGDPLPGCRAAFPAPFGAGGFAARPRPLPALLAAAWLWLASAIACAQEPDSNGKDDEEVQKAGPVDPYTGGDAEVMQAAGIVAYGPMPWADFLTTADLEKVLGERRILWLETAHFRIGSALKSTAWPDVPAKRKTLQADIRTLRKRLRKVAEKPKRIDPWLRLHLYAQRAENCYGDFQKLLGVTDADFPARGTGPREGAFLGQPDKFLLLLFQKKSDMARYMDRFCGLQNDSSMRYCHHKTHQMVACLSAEGLEGFDDLALHGHVTYALMHNLMSGYNGFHYQLPPWFAEGIAHWYSRQIPSDNINVQIRDDEAVAEDRQNNWPLKVRRRAQHEGAFFPFEVMAAWSEVDQMGYHAHAQAWSRVDYLMQKDAEKVGLMLRQLKALPVGTDGGAQQSAAARTLAVKLLAEVFELDPAGFDEGWRSWVLKTYPKS